MQKKEDIEEIGAGRVTRSLRKRLASTDSNEFIPSTPTRRPPSRQTTKSVIEPHGSLTDSLKKSVGRPRSQLLNKTIETIAENVVSSPTPRRRSTRRNSDLVDLTSSSDEMPVHVMRKPIIMMEIDEENEDKDKNDDQDKIEEKDKIENNNEIEDKNKNEDNDKIEDNNENKNEIQDKNINEDKDEIEDKDKIEDNNKIDSENIIQKTNKTEEKTENVNGNNEIDIDKSKQEESIEENNKSSIIESINDVNSINKSTENVLSDKDEKTDVVEEEKTDDTHEKSTITTLHSNAVNHTSHEDLVENSLIVEKSSEIESSIENKSSNILVEIDDSKDEQSVNDENNQINDKEDTEQNKLNDISAANQNENDKKVNLSNQIETSLETSISVDNNTDQNSITKSSKKVVFEEQTPKRISIIYPKTPISMEKFSAMKKKDTTESNNSNDKNDINKEKVMELSQHSDISCEMSDADVSLASDIINDNESLKDVSENSFDVSSSHLQNGSHKMPPLQISDSNVNNSTSIISLSDTSDVVNKTKSNDSKIEYNNTESNQIAEIVSEKVEETSSKSGITEELNNEQEIDGKSIDNNEKPEEMAKFSSDEEIDKNIESLANNIKRKLNDQNDSINIQTNIVSVHTPFTTKRRKLANSSTPIVKKIELSDEKIDSKNSTTENDDHAEEVMVTEVESRKEKSDEKQIDSVTSKFSKSWSQPITGLAAELKFIDGFGVKTKEDNETDDVIKPVILNKNRRKSSHEMLINHDSTSENDADDDVEANTEEDKEKNDLIDDEAEEVSDEDSMDEEERQYLKENEIKEHGISLGSDDTDENESINEESDDSFIVNDESDELLSGTDDLMNEKKSKKSRILQMSSDDDDDDDDKQKHSNSSTSSNVENIEQFSPDKIPNNEKLKNQILKKQAQSLQKSKNRLLNLEQSKLNKSLNDITAKTSDDSKAFIVEKKNIQKEKKPSDEYSEKIPIEKIINKCDSFINKLNEAKKEQKMANKQIKEDRTDRLKRKKELKLIARAKRAESLLKIEADAAEKRKRKMEKKVARSLSKEEKESAISAALAAKEKVLQKPIKETHVEIISSNTKKSPNILKQEQKDKTKSPNKNSIKQQNEKPNNQKSKSSTIESVPMNKDANELNNKKSKKMLKILQNLTSNQDNIQTVTNHKRKPAPIEIDPVVPKKAKKTLKILQNLTTDKNGNEKPSKLPKNDKSPVIVGGFKVSSILPAKPIASGFKVQSISSAGQTKKRKRAATEIIEPKTQLNKPQWTSAGQFVVSKMPKIERTTHKATVHTSVTDFLVTSLDEKVTKLKNKKSTKIATIESPTNAAFTFKEKALFSDRHVRENSKQMLQRKEKQKAYNNSR